MPIPDYAFDIYPYNNPRDGARLVRLTRQDLLPGTGWRKVHLGAGSGHLVINHHHDAVTEDNFHEDNYVRVVDVTNGDFDAPVIGGFFLSRGDFPVISRQGETGAGRVVKFGGPDLVSYFGRAIFYHTPFAPGQGKRGSINEPGFWTWKGQPYGAILFRMIEEGKWMPGSASGQSPLEWFNANFSKTNATNGPPWSEIADLYRRAIGNNMMDAIEDFIRLGVIIRVDYDTWQVSAYESYGEDRSGLSYGAGVVRFERSVNIEQLTRQLEPSAKASHVMAIGDDYQYQTAEDDTMLPVRYATVDAGFTNSADAVEKAAEKDQEARLRQSNTAIFPLPLGNDESLGFYRPGVHFDAGDTASVSTVFEGTFDIDEGTMPIAAYTIGIKTDKDTAWRGDVELGEVYVSAEDRAFEARVSSIVHQVSAGPKLAIPDQFLTGPGTIEPDATILADVTDLVLNPNPWETDAELVIPDEENLMLLIQIITQGTSGGITAVRYRPTPGSATGQQTPTQLEYNSEAGTAGCHGVYVLANPTPSAGGSIHITLGSGETRMKCIAVLLHNVAAVRDSAIDYRSSAEGPIPVVVNSDDSDTIIGLHAVDSDGADPVGADELINDSNAAGNYGASSIASWTGSGPTGSVEFDMWGTTAAVSFQPSEAVLSLELFDGHADLVGVGGRASRNDHQHHVLRTTAPDTDEDRSAGYPDGTVWVQVDDIETPTTVLGMWRLIDETTGFWQPLDRIESMHTSETDTNKRLAPDGAGGVEWVEDTGSSSSLTPLRAFLAQAHLVGGVILLAHRNEDGSDPDGWVHPGSMYGAWLGDLTAFDFLLQFNTGGRDPSLLIYDDRWWEVHTSGVDDSFGLRSTDDPGVEFPWGNLVQPDCSSPDTGGTVQNTWAPHWFVDPMEPDPLARIHVLVNLETTGFRIYELHPTNNAMTTWSDPVELTLGTGTWASKIIDGSMVYAPDVGDPDKPYKLWYKTDDSDKRIEVAEGPTMFGPFDQWLTGDWAGWYANRAPGANSIEGPSVIRLPGNRWACYFAENSGFSGVQLSVALCPTNDWEADFELQDEVVLTGGYAFQHNHPHATRIYSATEHGVDVHAHPELSSATHDHDADYEPAGAIDDHDADPDAHGGLAASGHYEVLMTGSGAGLEPITNMDETDWLYGWVSD